MHAHEKLNHWLVQLPPTQSRGRGVEGVFGSALEPNSPTSEASPDLSKAQGNLAAITPGISSAERHIGHNQSSSGPHYSWQKGWLGKVSDAATSEQQQCEPPAACHTPQSTPGQAPKEAQDTPGRPWEQPPANAAQHLMSRSSHRGRGRGGPQGRRQQSYSPGHPSPPKWGTPNAASSAEQRQQQSRTKEDSPGESNVPSAAHNLETPCGVPSTWPQQPGHMAQDSPGESTRDASTQQWVNRHGAPLAWEQQGHVSCDSPRGSLTMVNGDGDGMTPAQQQQQQQQHNARGGCGGTDGGPVAPSWQAQRLPGQVHCPVTPPSVSGRAGDYTVPVWQPAAVSEQGTTTPHSATHVSTALASPPTLPPLKAAASEAAWPKGARQGSGPATNAAALGADHGSGGDTNAVALGAVLPVNVVRKWLRADVGENTAYLLNEPVWFLYLALNTMLSKFLHRSNAWKVVIHAGCSLFVLGLGS
jgi:hypothetical protein